MCNASDPHPGPLKSGKSTFCKWVDKKYKHFNLVTTNLIDDGDVSIDRLVDEVCPQHGVDVTKTPCIIDEFSMTHEQWKLFTRGSSVLAGGEEALTKIRDEKDLASKDRVRQEREVRKVLIVSLDCSESGMLVRWWNDQKDKRRGEAQENLQREFQSQNKGIKTMLDNMKGGNLIEVVELKATATEDIEATMKKWTAEIKEKGDLGEVSYIV